MKKFLLFVLTLSIILFTVSNAFSQCSDQQCPPGAPVPGNNASDACILCSLSELDGQVFNTGGFSPTIAPPTFCGSVENNSWFSFIATQEDISITISASNCTGNDPTGGGLQGAMYQTSDCISFTEVSNCSSTTTTAPFVLTTNTPLTPGGIYYIMIDGWGGDVCDYTVTVNNPAGGGGTPPPLPPPTDIFGGIGNKVCIPEFGTTNETFTVSPVSGASNFIWSTTDGVGITNPSDPTQFDVTFFNPGTVTICVEAINECVNGEPYCEDFIIEPVINPPVIDIEYCSGEQVVCYGQTYSNDPVGVVSTTVQSYLGCDSMLSCNLIPIFPIVNDLGSLTECAPFCFEAFGEEFCETEFIDIGGTNWQGCDSFLFLDLVILDPIANILPPGQLGCSSTSGQLILDGNNSNTGPFDGTTSYSWTGPSFCGPTDEVTACVDQPGEYCLTLTHERDGVSCSDQVCVDVTQNIEVPNPPTITVPPGPVCEGDMVIYTIQNFSGPAPSGYTVTTPNGEPVTMIDFNNYQVEWNNLTGGQLCVVANSDCGDSEAACIDVTINEGPDSPTFSGELNPCANQSYTYSVDSPNSNNTYNWTAPGAVINGSGASVNIDFGNAGTVTICVNSSNSCGTSPDFCQDVTVTGPPATPVLESGNVNVCGTVSEEYCVTNDPDAVDYTWTTPVGNFNNAGNCQVLDWAGSTGGQVCVTANNDCDSSPQLCFDVTVEQGPTATMSGGGNFCANSGDLVDINVVLTGTGPWVFIYNDGSTDVTVNLTDANSIIQVGIAGNYTPVSVTDQSSCPGSVSGNALVLEDPQPTAVLSGSGSICSGSGETADLTITLTGTPPWTVNYSIDGNPAAPITGIGASPATLSISEAQAGDIEITGITDGNGCTNTGDGTVITVEVTTAPTVSNIQTTCNATATGYIVTFQINGGDSGSYSVTPNDGSISGSAPWIFTSNEIPSGDGYSFVVTDANDCNSVTVDQAAVICDCDTEVGDMGATTINECGDGPVTAVYDNTNETLDADDVVVFILHEGSGVSILNPIATNPTDGTFSFDAGAGMTYGQTYYISAVAGNDDGAGGVDLNDGCTDIAQGTPVVFYELPTATITTDVEICEGATADIIVDFTGQGPWNLTYDAGNGDETINGITANPYTLNVTSAATTTVTLTGVASVYPMITCDGTANGSIQVTINTAVEVLNVVETCNATGTEFTVTFEITGGDPTSYSVTPAGGTISATAPYIYTSASIPTGSGYSFTVDDTNSCDPQTVDNNQVICDCTTEVGVMDSDTIVVCGDGPETAIYDDALQVFDGDDLLNFILHTGSSNNIGTIIQTNETGATFGFDAGAGMNYGTVYYVSAIVGNNDGVGVVDLNDPCLAVAIGSPIVFFEVPMGTLSSDGVICEGDSIQLSVDLLGDAPWSIEVTDNNGNVETYDNINNNPYNFFVMPSATTTYTLTNVSDENSCPGDPMGDATITVNDAPTVGVPSITFNATNTGYTVSVVVSGGDPNSYFVTPVGGTFVDDNGVITWTSDEQNCGDGYSFAFDDANGCGPAVISQTSVTCNCETEAGDMDLTTNPITFCGNGPIVGTYAGGETLDGNDVISYVLIENGGIIAQNVNPSFNYNATTMSYGTTYQLCAVAGDDNGGGLANQADPCYSIGDVCVDITFFEVPTATISGTGAICEGESIDLTIQLTGTPPFDLSYQNTNTSEIFDETGIATTTFTATVSPTTTASFTLLSATDANGCDASTSGLVTVTVNNPPVVSNLTETCNAANTEFTVQFQIAGGNGGPYTVNPAGSGIVDASGLFTSNPLANGSSYNFEVDDANGCGPVVVSGAFACDCDTEVGTIQETSLIVCENETADVTHTGQVLDVDDIVTYIIHDGSAVPVGNILATSDVPSIAFDPATMEYEVEYIFSVVIGSDDGTGNVDFDDPCFDEISIPVLFGQNPTLTFGDDSAYCTNSLGFANAEVQLTLPTPGSFNVVFNDGSTNISGGPFSNGDIYSLNITNTTTLSVVSITNVNTGCTGTSTDEVIFTLNEEPLVGQTPDDLVFCEGDGSTVNLFSLLDDDANPSGTWTNSNGSPVAGGNLTISALVDGTNTFTYTVQGVDPCPSASFDFDVIVEPLPVADAGADQTLTCSVSEVTLGGDNNTPGATYQWDGPVDNLNGAKTTVSLPGTYTLTVTTAAGCVATDVVTVDVDQDLPEDVILSIGDVQCFGESNGFFSVDSIVGGQPPYLFSFNDGPFTAQSIYTNLSAGPFTVAVQDANGCEIAINQTMGQPDEQVNVDINAEPGNTEGDEVTATINLGESINLSIVPSPAFGLLDSVLWTSSDTSLVFCESCDEIVLDSLQEQVTFTVYVESEGCSDTDQITIFVEKDLEVYAPNVFAPEGSSNKRFYLQSFPGVVEVIDELAVYNRWGEVVYQVFDIAPNMESNGWNGNDVNGEIYDTQVFVWKAKVTFVEGTTKTFVGDVMLLR